ncbi:MAG: histidinol-phosphatase [Bacillota bacterium]
MALWTPITSAFNARYDHHVHLLGAYTGRQQDEWMEAIEQKGWIPVFTEHSYIFREAKGILDIAWATERCLYTLDQYIRWSDQFRESGVPVKVGLEVDYVRGKERRIEKLLSEHPWDMVIGSVHWDGEEPFDDVSGRFPPPCRDKIRRYFGILREMVSTGLFDVLGHLDVFRAAGTCDSGYEEWDEVTEILRLAAERGMVIELNTGGLRKPTREAYPRALVLDSAAALGMSICLSSDAHSPGELGFHLEQSMSGLTQRYPGRVVSIG